MARISILIDSTGSMGRVIDAVKGKVMDMIEKLNKSYSNKFEIQILFYYGFKTYQDQCTDSKEERWCLKNKLHVSDWTSDIERLKEFVENS
jgi:hypothetical protein